VIRSPRPAAASASRRRGQALIEFAIIAFLLTLLLAGLLTFGLLLHGANVIQQAADVGAMELARHPFSATGDFESALADSALFREADLVLVPGTDPQTLPLINRLLFPVYIYDPDIDRVRYPGTLVNTSDDELTVLIPIVGSRDPTTGVETIARWLPVVQEIRPDGQDRGPYSLDATASERGTLDPGMVALRINYPYQSGAMVAYMQQDGGGTFVPPAEALGRNDIVNIPIQADDSSVTGNTTPPAPYTLANPATNPLFEASAHRGVYGLGEAQAFAVTVRPYRKVLSAQAIYRREVFSE
jgi:hypothetical protein